MTAWAKTWNWALLLTLVLSGASAWAESITIRDIAGRDVRLSGPAERIVAVGPGSARLVAYFGAISRLVGIEAMDQQPPGGRAYALAHHPRFMDLPLIGQGGPGRSVDAEAILGLRPDAVIANLFDRADAERLSRQVRRPVVMVSFGSDGVYDPELVLRSIEIVGTVLGLPERADDLTSFIEATEADLARRVASARQASEPSVFVGAISMRGQHGIASTQSRFLPLTLLHTPSPADHLAQGTRHLFIDLEQLLLWDPRHIFIDTSGLPRVIKEVNRQPGFFARLEAFRRQRVLTLFPFNHYGTNIELAFANAYFIGSVLYPQAFADVDPHEKLEALAGFFLGPVDTGPLYREYPGFQLLTLHDDRLAIEAYDH
ncbi:MAG: ABC transporter substrate-binding protein [Wenzhouxiangella sp.]